MIRALLPAHINNCLAFRLPHALGLYRVLKDLECKINWMSGRWQLLFSTLHSNLCKAQLCLLHSLNLAAVYVSRISSLLRAMTTHNLHCEAQSIFFFSMGRRNIRHVFQPTVWCVYIFFKSAYFLCRNHHIGLVWEKKKAGHSWYWNTLPKTNAPAPTGQI